MDAEAHWEKVYATKAPTDVSWYQPDAELSLKLIRQAAPDHAAAIIDVGGGASTLVDGLLAEGYANVTVLDLSVSALGQAAARLGDDAGGVRWVEADIRDADLPVHAYDVWHDRAVFHFLTAPADRRRYVEQVLRAVKVGGHVLVATFAGDGPTHCSGLEVARYEPDELHAQFGSEFELVRSVREQHKTPSGAVQPFVYCMCRVG